MGLRVLKVLKPFIGILPDVESPIQRVPFNERLLYTAIALLAYLVMAQLPLYGIISSESSDPLYYLRVVLGANRGTLAELGVLPILSSGTLLQFLAATGAIRVDYGLKEDRALFCGAQKLLAVLIAIIQALALVFTGLYGNPTEIGTLRCGLLVLQLVVSSYVILSLDELIQKGYGLGSGINLFVTAHLCQHVFWNSLSFTSVSTIRGDEKQGAIISLFSLITSRSSKVRAIKDAFYRDDVANMLNVIATVVIFGAVVYIQGFRIELPVVSNRMRGQRATYPIKLFYTSAMPVMLQSALFANSLLISYVLFTFFGDNFLIRIFGIWGPVGSQVVPVGGLVYYLCAPHGLVDAIFAPVHTIVYFSITVVTCAYLSKIWVDISGSTSRDVAKTLKDQQLTIAGFRDASMYKELQRIIPVAATFGGAVLAIVAVAGDILGAIGSGAGILTLIMIILQYFEMFVREQMEGNMTMEAMMGGSQ